MIVLVQMRRLDSPACLSSSVPARSLPVGRGRHFATAIGDLCCTRLTEIESASFSEKMIGLEEVREAPLIYA